MEDDSEPDAWFTEYAHFFPGEFLKHVHGGDQHESLGRDGWTSGTRENSTMAIEANTTPHARVPSGALGKACHAHLVAKSPNQMWKACHGARRRRLSSTRVAARTNRQTGATCVVLLFHFCRRDRGTGFGAVARRRHRVEWSHIGRPVLPRVVLFSPEQLSQPGFRAPSAALNWALSGYSNPTVWLIFGAFILALGYERTGLGERIALILVKRMGKNTLLLGYGVTLADAILAPFIPPPTARSGGIIYPIVSDLAQVYESKPNDPSARRVGSYLMWVAIATTCVTSSLFLTAASFNLLAVGLVEKLTQTDVHWMDWFRTSATAIIPLLLILIPLLSYCVLYPPEVKHSTEVSKWAALKLEKIGPLSRRELILAAIVVLSLVLWVGGSAFLSAQRRWPSSRYV